MKDKVLALPVRPDKSRSCELGNLGRFLQGQANRRVFYIIKRDLVIGKR